MGHWKQPLIAGLKAVFVGALISIVGIFPVFFLMHLFGFIEVPRLSTGRVFLGASAVVSSAYVLLSFLKTETSFTLLQSRRFIFAIYTVFGLWVALHAKDFQVVFPLRFIAEITVVFLVAEAVILLNRNWNQSEKKQFGFAAITKKILKKHLNLHSVYRTAFGTVSLLLIVDLFLRAPVPHDLILVIALIILGWTLRHDRYAQKVLAFVQHRAANTPSLKRPWLVAAVTLVITAGSFLRIYDLNQQSFHADEFNQIAAFEGYLQTGEFVQWDFVNNTELRSYNRSTPYTVLASKSIEVFGFNEFGARLPGAIVSSLALIVLFFVTRFFTSSTTALWTTTFYAFYPVAIYFSRYTRNYSVTLPFYLLLAFAGYQCLDYGERVIESIRQKKGISRSVVLLILWVTVAIISFALSYKLNVLTLNFIPAFFTGAVLYFVRTDLFRVYWKRYVLGSAIFALFIGVFVLANAIGFLDYVNVQSVLGEHLSIQTLSNPRNYVKLIFESLNFPSIGALLFFLGIAVLSIRAGKKEMYIFAIAFVPLLMSVYLWNRHVGIRYVFTFTPFFFLFTGVALSFLTSVTIKYRTALARRMVPATTVILILFFTAIPLSVPGFSLPPLLQPAAVDWTRDDAVTVNSRGVDPEHKKAFSHINREWREGDAIVTTLRHFVPIYLQPERDSSDIAVYNLVRDSSLVYAVNDFNRCKPGELEVVPFKELEQIHERIWFVVDNIHWWKPSAVQFLLKNTSNEAKKIGIKSYNYNNFYKNKDLYWPSVFLMDLDPSPTQTLEDFSRCQ